MKKKLMFFLMLLVSAVASAQSIVDSVSVAETNARKQIWGKSVDLNKHILGTACDDSMIVVLACDTTKKGKITDNGYLYALNTHDLKMAWEKPLNLSMSRLFAVASQGVLLSTTLRSSGKSLLTLADKHTGKSIWTQYLYPVYIDASLDIIVGLDKIGSSNTYAYRLSDGQLLWNAEIPMTKNVGWSHACMVDSVHLVVVGDDINEIDVNTGKIWKMKAKTGVSDTKGIAMLALTNVLSVAAAVGLGSSVVTYFYNLNPYTITGLTSNILRSGLDIFVSDRKSLYRLGTDSLQVRWKYDFQDKEASTAELLMREGKLLMLNYGYGNSLMRGRVKCGKPFLAVFDAETGRREKMIPLYDKKHIMNDGMLTADGVFLAGSDKVVHLSFQDSTVVAKDWKNGKNIGDLLFVAHAPYYGFHGDDEQMTLIEPTSKTCPMMTTKKKLFVFDEKLDTLSSYDISEVFRVRFRVNDVVCVQNCEESNNFWLIKIDGTPVGKMKWKPTNVLLRGENAIAVYEHKVSVFQLPVQADKGKIPEPEESTSGE